MSISNYIYLYELKPEIKNDIKATNILPLKNQTTIQIKIY